MRYIAIIILICSVFLAGCGVGDKYNDFVQCISDEGVVMYGAFWCSHCNSMKQNFGTAVKYLDYVECDDKDPSGQPELCDKKGIKVYPSFEFDDGTVLTGELSFEIISQKTGCPLPEE